MPSISLLNGVNRPQAPVSKKTLSINIAISQQTLRFDLPDLHVSHPVDPSPDATFDQDLPMHMKFRAKLDPESEAEAKFRDRCTTDIRTINMLYPGLKPAKIRICCQAWFAFVCSLDDTLETLSEAEGEAILLESINVFRGDYRPTLKDAKSSKIAQMTRTFRDYTHDLLPSPIADSFFHAVYIVFQAFLDEGRFRKGQIQSTYSNYMDIRCHTISLGPLLQLVKHEMGFQDSSLNTQLEILEHQAFSAAGLQNDLLGLERDLQDGEHMNGVVVLLQERGGNLDQLDPELLRKSIEELNQRHNDHISLLLDSFSELISACNGAPSQAVLGVVQYTTLLCERHLRWCSSAKRYSVENESVVATCERRQSC